MGSGTENRENLQPIKAIEWVNTVHEISVIASRMGQGGQAEGILDALETSRKLLEAQCLTLYIRSKNGNLERYAIAGIDREGHRIKQQWFEDDIHIAHDIRTPKQSKKDNFNPFLRVVQNSDELLPGQRKKYTDKLGNISCIMSAPISSRRGVLGVLQAINKVQESDFKKRIENKIYDNESFLKLNLIANALSQSISARKIHDMQELREKIYLVLADNSTEAYDRQGIFDDIAHLLVGPYTAYKACIIRLRLEHDDDHLLPLVTQGAPGVDFSRRKMREAIKPRTIGDGSIVAQVFETGERFQAIDIKEFLHKYRNSEWIDEQGLKSHICLPLKAKQKIVGTISLFTGYEYIFEDDVRDLEIIAGLIATSLASTWNKGMIQQAIRENDVEQVRFHHSINEFNETRQQSLSPQPAHISSSSALGANILENKNRRGLPSIILKDSDPPVFTSKMKDKRWVAKHLHQYVAIANNRIVEIGKDKDQLLYQLSSNHADEDTFLGQITLDALAEEEVLSIFS